MSLKGPGSDKPTTAAGPVSELGTTILMASGMPTPQRRCWRPWAWVRARRVSPVRGTLQGVDGEELDAALGEWAACSTSWPGVRRAIAVDGKNVRGTRGATGAPRHLMAAIDHHIGVVIGQVNVERKTNEIPIFSQLCDLITDLQGMSEGLLDLSSASGP